MSLWEKIKTLYLKYKNTLEWSSAIFLLIAIILFLLDEEQIARWCFTIFFVTFITFLLIDLIRYIVRVIKKVK